MESKKKKEIKDCPHCKRCPQCGRRDIEVQPWYPYRYIPWDTTPWVYPWTDVTTWTSTTTTDNDTWTWTGADGSAEITYA